MPIAVYDCEQKFVGVFDEDVVKPRIKDGTAKLITSRDGRDRKVYMSSERDHLNREDLAALKRTMRDSIPSGTKYTYELHFERAAPCHVLKLAVDGPDGVEYQRWPGE